MSRPRIGMVQREVLDLLGRPGFHADIDWLCEVIGRGVSRASVSRAVYRLVELGLVTVCARGRCALTSTGEALVGAEHLAPAVAP
jgi:hypothetical protein